MKTIIAVSGGLDSTYTLWKLLMTTKDDVTAILFNVGSLTREDSNRYDVRGFDPPGAFAIRVAQVQKIIDYLNANTRPVTLRPTPLTPDILSKDNLTRPNNMQSILTNYGVAQLNSGALDKIAFATEHENDGFSHGGTVPSGDHTLRRPGNMVAEEIFQKDAMRGELSFPLLDMNYHQGHALSEMPAELTALTRSCWSDRDTNQSCGVCFKCVKRKFFADQLAMGKTPGQITDYVSAKSSINGRWLSMKKWLGDEYPDVYKLAGDDRTTWHMPTWPTSQNKNVS